jgi:hypothetical protein
MRADYKASSDADISLKGVTGHKWTKDQEEQFEKGGASFLREGGFLPARMFHGLQIQRGIDAYVGDLSAVQWGIIRTQGGHLIAPDYPAYTIIPLTPTLCLCSGGQDGTITRQNIAELNHSFKAVSVEYFFAQDFAQCP